MLRRSLALWSLVLLALVPLVARAEGPVLKAGDKVAIVGDSITEQRLYSKFVECYLLACSGVPDLSVFQYGWSGETAAGFANRLENDCASFGPTVVTLCYGMNDGGYQPFNEQIGKNYETNMRRILDGLAKLGVRSIVVGSPGAVDQNFFRRGTMLGDRPAHVAYNDNLAHLRDIDKKLATEHKQAFANVHDAMVEAMQKAQEKLGPQYHVCGSDGFHPAPNGQLVMAYAFLKGLGIDGNLGEISVDLAGKAEVAGSHILVGASGGTVEIESTRWPFCFEGSTTAPEGTRSITPFVPFNADLNRLTLKVKGLDIPKAKVTWGETSKEFTNEQLAAGINLAAEFDKTPFDASFQKLVAAVTAKQQYETFMIKQIVTIFRSMPAEVRADPEVQAAQKVIGASLLAHQQRLAAAAKALIVPVKHKLTVEPAL